MRSSGSSECVCRGCAATEGSAAIEDAIFTLAMKGIVVFLPLALGACGEARMALEAPVVRDSAGVTIVESSPPYSTWSLDPTPVTRVGVVSGDPAYQLSDVAYAARLSDGGVVVVDGGSSEVRWYDSDGGFRSRAAGPGEGPGELLRVVGAALTPGDTLVLYDARNRRLSWFASDGTVSRLRRLALGPGSEIGLHPLQDGRLLATEERHTLNLAGDEYNPARDSVLVLLATGANESVDTVMRLPGSEALTWVDYEGGTPVGTMQTTLPFGEVALAGGTADRIAVVGAGRDELALFDTGARLVRVARRSDVDPLQVSSSMRQQYVAAAVDRVRSTGLPVGRVEAAAEERLTFLPEERAVPAFDRLLTDAVGGQIWLRDYLPEWRSGEARSWTVYDLAGQVVGRLTTPAGFEVMQVGDGHIVGVERDEMGVEYVVVFPVQKPSSSPSPATVEVPIQEES